MHQGGEQGFYRGSDRIVGGVCSGLAAGFHVNVLWFRIAFVLLAFLQGIGVLIYIVLWLVMPERVDGKPAGSGFDSMAADMRRIVRELQGQFGGLVGRPVGNPAAAPASGRSQNESVLLGLVLVLVGAILLGANIGLFSWNVVWPAALIAVGVVLLIRTFQKKS
jgi:phage shock protein C